CAERPLRTAGGESLERRSPRRVREERAERPFGLGAGDHPPTPAPSATRLLVCPPPKTQRPLPPYPGLTSMSRPVCRSIVRAPCVPLRAPVADPSPTRVVQGSRRTSPIPRRF